MLSDPNTIKPGAGPVRVRRPAFWTLAMRCTQIAALVDIAFFILFLALDSPVLAWVNVVSVGMYVGAYYALKTRRNRLAVWLFWTEVLAHAALGITMIGWGSGFHYYLLLFIPAICLSAPRKWVFPGLCALWAYYVALDVLMWSIEPLQPIPQTALYVVHLFNLTVVFAMFSYLSVFYLGVVIATQRKLQAVAITDVLTGLLNRRQMQYLLDQEVERFKRSGQPMGLMLLDLDHFKQINDTYGHDMGDKVLQEFAVVLNEQFRSQDLVARWGGEEFLVAMPNSTGADVVRAAERVCQATAGRDWSEWMGEGRNVTVSIGVSEIKAGDDAAQALSRADEALYQSKASGRNCVTELKVGSNSGSNKKHSVSC
ncbi:GGDEF domain-containing protein [Marinobacter daepoensis]|uniref:diguanylate cyclase n=1 Tax=Marinobacter daepoensis TaxID=262077 RepID=A0ABS3BC77_9GAMM|nr:GGDEF domain-containing protein [Marinobacter daepoensis]MBN7769153.1 GGDEF domain-containing protein [Marinobacter daepoensis]MBY6032234.1 GGDEF domain-containing protein [Marinobacter daepoensis]MBY6077843.1 GGDEF domain-containing protein [Marinobacter daepoensis]